MEGKWPHHHCQQLQTATVLTTSWPVQILVVSSEVNVICSGYSVLQDYFGYDKSVSAVQVSGLF
jgi:hypothetical protein